MEQLVKAALQRTNGLHTIKNVVVTDVVKTTMDYKMFKHIVGNREIDLVHVKKIKQSMQEHDLMIPIIVNENMEVIDGQHRLKARQELGIVVYYIIIKGLTIRDTQKANQNNKNWKGTDFLNFFVKQNYYSYKILNDFIKKYKFNLQVSMVLLAGAKGAADTTGWYDFTAGNFSIKNADDAIDKAEKLYELQPFYEGFKRRSFVFAILSSLQNEKFFWDEFLLKVSYQSSKLVDCTDVQAYLGVLEDIYNFKRKTEDKIRLRK